MGQSKLFKLKKWLTVPDAARHLSSLFEEEVSEADVLLLALDNHLKISVNFVNKAYVKRGKIVSLEDAEWYPPDSFVAKFLGIIKEISPKPVLRSLRIDEEHFIHFEDEVSAITGVWDLSMIGNELLDIQHKYQMLTGGPGVTLIGIDGPFVDGQDGLIWQIQERFADVDKFYDEDQFTDFDLKNIANGNISKERLLENRKERKNRPFNHPENYYPADGLPEDSVLVVRTSALRELEDRCFADQQSNERPPSKRQQDSDLHIIGALLEVIVEGKLFASEEKLRDHIADQYRGYSGCASRTLAGRFADAKKLLRLAE